MLSVLDPIYLFISTERQERRVWVCISPFTVGEMKYQMLGDLGKKVYLAHGFGTVSVSCIRQALVRASLAVSLCGKQYHGESTCKRERLNSETESRGVGGQSCSHENY